MGTRKIAATVVGTLLMMWLANQAAARSPMARKLLKGSAVSGVSNGNTVAA